MAQLRSSGVTNFQNTTAATPGVVSTGGAMPEDPRSAGVLGSATDAGYIGFIPMTVTAAGAPSAISATNIATGQTGASGVALILTAGTGISTGTVSGVAAFFIDGAPSATNQTGDPTLTFARAIRVTSTGNDATVTFTISGWDLYNNVQTQSFTGGSGSAITSTKCFKAIRSITPSTGTANSVTVGTADVFAFPMRVDNFDEAIIFYNSAQITVPTGFTAAVSTAANATSGDPKGKYAVQSATDATKRLVIYQAAKSYTNATTLFGVTPA